MTIEQGPDIFKVEVEVWTDLRAEENGFRDFLPEGTIRVAVAVARGEDGKIVEAKAMLEVKDLMGLVTNGEYEKEVINKARLLYGLDPEN